VKSRAAESMGGTPKREEELRAFPKSGTGFLAMTHL